MNNDRNNHEIDYEKRKDYKQDFNEEYHVHLQDVKLQKSPHRPFSMIKLKTKSIFLKDHVTLKTGVMMLKIKLLKYIQIENSYFKL